MKVAILLRGSSINTYEHWQFKEQVSVDYRNNIDNLKTNLLNNYDCDVFFHTWKEADRDNNEYDQLALDFNAKAYAYDDDIGGAHGPELGKKVVLNAKRVIEIYNQYKQKTNTHYDLVVMIRFDVYLFHKLDLETIRKTQELHDRVFVYAMGPNLKKKYIDKESTKDIGIDDNLIVFTPDVIDNYYDCLNMKEDTVAINRDPGWFNPTQHCSLHHLYYLLEDHVKIKNLVDILTYADKKSLYGIIKNFEPNSRLVRGCPTKRKSQLGNGLFVIHYE
tara:strand:- start:8820 stop:9647 length:828 start_codon:yes stop_codon:yes gene_type:complete